MAEGPRGRGAGRGHATDPGGGLSRARWLTGAAVSGSAAGGRAVAAAAIRLMRSEQCGDEGFLRCGVGQQQCGFGGRRVMILPAVARPVAPAFDVPAT